MIKWKDDYRIGVSSIDEQHKKLFEIANNAYDLLKKDYYVDKYDHIIQLIQELEDYTVYHFDTEQQYMQKIGYKKYLSHKVVHDDFIQKIKDTNYRQIDENQDEYVIELLEFVVSWIEKHILGNDMLIVK